MLYKPYGYQQKVYEQVMDLIDNGEHSIVVQMCTRSGKSIVALLLIEYFSVMLKESVYFIGHTNILLTQMSDDLITNGIKHGIIAPWAPKIFSSKVQVISKDTLFNRYKNMKESGWKNPRIIIVDECHISMSKRYKEILESYPDSIIIGLSATPTRLDGKGLDSIYKTMVTGPSIKQLQKIEKLCLIDNYVVDFDTSGIRTTAGDYNNADVNSRVDKPQVLKDIVKHWEIFAKNKKTLTFCASIQHAKDMAKQFNDAGYPSVHISSKDGRDEIKKKISDYYSGKYINLCSINLFIMGFTIRDCECIVQASPTKSLMKYLQSLGRGMMFVLGKTLINLDMCNNYTIHGLPDEDRIWNLTGSKGTGSPEASKYKRCPQCFRPVKIHNRNCPWCQYEFEFTGSRLPKQKEGSLRKIEPGGQPVQTAVSGWSSPDSQRLIKKIAMAKSLGDAKRIAIEAGETAGKGWMIWKKILKRS
jgi:DNA repair protein RadD